MMYGWGWHKCAECGQMRYQNKEHDCPPAIKEARDAAVAEETQIEMEFFDESLGRFWDEDETKFQQWLAENDKI